MLIAITQRNSEEHGGCDILESTYTTYFSKLGVTLVAIPNEVSLLKEYFKTLPFNGIVLSGGGDVDPALYNSNRSDLSVCSSKRDETERGLLDIAMKKEIPVLGICRGMQKINVYFGGTLIQSIKKEIGTAVDHKETKHIIKLSDEPIIKLLHTDTSQVNSHHNLGIDSSHLSKRLLPFATAIDNTIEGFFHPNHAIAGIMWHPEREVKPHALNSLLVNAFLAKTLFWKKSNKKI